MSIFAKWNLTLKLTHHRSLVDRTGRGEGSGESGEGQQLGRAQDSCLYPMDEAGPRARVRERVAKTCSDLFPIVHPMVKSISLAENPVGMKASAMIWVPL
jgi:hypothetical protein